MKLIWTDLAQENLREIHKRTLCRHDEAAADQVVDRIIARGEQLKLFPESGHRPEPDKFPAVRQVIVKPYRVVYRVLPDAIEVLNVFHCARQHL